MKSKKQSMSLAKLDERYIYNYDHKDQRYIYAYAFSGFFDISMHSYRAIRRFYKVEPYHHANSYYLLDSDVMIIFEGLKNNPQEILDFFNLKYLKYLPELKNLDPKKIHDPDLEIRKKLGYPAPIVDYSAQRKFAIESFKKIKI